MPSFLQRLFDHERFVITTHLRADGDAVGSSMALARFLEKAGKSARVIVPDAISPNLEWLPGADDILVFDGSFGHLESIASADALVVMDTNAASRIGLLADSFVHSGVTRVLIDHHPSPESWFDLVNRRESASSTGEIVVDLIREHESESGQRVVDGDIATLLYTAIMTDTGSFRFSNVSPKVHRDIAMLIERGGLVPDEIHARLYDTRTLTSLRLLGKALERIDLRYEGRLGFLALSRQFMTDAGGERGDTEGLVNYILSIEGVRVAVFFLETDRGTKVSLRSHGDTPVNRWAASMGGGGHPNASGAFVEGDLDAVVQPVLDAAPRFLPWLSDEGDHPGEGRDELSTADAEYLSLLNTRSSR